MILCANPKAQYEARKTEIDKAVTRVLASGWYVLGKEVSSFEQEFAEYVGVKHAVGVANGTEAIALALMACGVGIGDEVITVSHTATATVAAIRMLGAEPIFVDIDPNYHTLAPARLVGAVTRKTKAIVPVHLYGQPADMNSIMTFAKNKGLRVVEDCAQAHGAFFRKKMVGSIGDMAAFSFYPTKNLGALGDAGIIVTNNSKYAENAKRLREYGWKDRFVSVDHGWNSRLDEMQAAVLREKLKFLTVDNESRRRIAEFYMTELAELPIKMPKIRKKSEHVFHLFVLETERRDELLAYLKENGVGASIHYPVPVHKQPAYSQNVFLPVTESLVERIISLPIYPELSDEDLQKIVTKVKEFLF